MIEKVIEKVKEEVTKTVNEKGFTLIELIVVVALLGIVTAVAVTTGLRGGADRAALNAQTEQLISDLRLLRTQAVAAQLPGTFEISNQSDGYETKVSTIRDTIELPRGIIISGNPNNLTTLTFNADGTISGSGTGPYILNLSVDDETKCVEISKQGLIKLVQNVQPGEN